MELDDGVARAIMITLMDIRANTEAILAILEDGDEEEEEADS